MSDIRFNNWLHQSGTGGVYQNSAGNIGIGTTVPRTSLDVVGVVSATSFSGNVNAPGNSTFDGSVGIGTDNPFTSKLHVFGKQRVSASAKNLTTDFFVLSSNDNSSTRNELIFRQRASDNDWEIEAVEQNTGYRNVWIKNGNLKFTSGNGIDFSSTADGASTASSELFDDYEEGSWTPVVYLNGVLQSLNIGAHSRYLKIGKLVYLEFWMGFGNYGQSAFPSTNTTAFEIGGLPYTINDTTFPGSLGSARTQNGLSSNFSISVNGSQRISFWNTGGSYGNWLGVGKLSANQISTNTDMVLAGSYSYYN